MGAVKAVASERTTLVAGLALLVLIAAAVSLIVGALTIAAEVPDGEPLIALPASLFLPIARVRWEDGDVLRFRAAVLGQTITGTIDVADDRVRLAGLLLTFGAEMLWYPVGWTAGYLVLLNDAPVVVHFGTTHSTTAPLAIALLAAFGTTLAAALAGIALGAGQVRFRPATSCACT